MKLVLTPRPLKCKVPFIILSTFSTLTAEGICREMIIALPVVSV